MQSVARLLAFLTAGSLFAPVWAEDIELSLTYLVTVSAKLSGERPGDEPPTTWKASVNQKMTASKKWRIPSLSGYYLAPLDPADFTHTVTGGGEYHSGAGDWSWSLSAYPWSAYVFQYGAYKVVGFVEFPGLGDLPQAPFAVVTLPSEESLSDYVVSQKGPTSDHLRDQIWSMWREAREQMDAPFLPLVYWSPPKPQSLASWTVRRPFDYRMPIYEENEDGIETGEVLLHVEYTLSAGPPKAEPPPKTDDEYDKKCEAAGSIIGCRDQSLGEEVELPGVPFRLRYQSERTLGRLGAGAAWTAEKLNFGGWTPTVHHAWDAAGQMLYLGSGTRRSGANVKPVTLPGGGFAVPEPDGTNAFVFDASGRHLRTVDQLTGASVFEFGYDSAGALIAVKDRSGNVTTIERSAGRPAAIVGPYGHRSTLTLDSNGYLASIRGPDGATTSATYSGTGLMLTFTDPRGFVSRFAYDTAGRLTRDEDAAGGYKTLTNLAAAPDLKLQLKSALGRTTTYSTTFDAQGKPSSTTELPDGTLAALGGPSMFPNSLQDPTGMAHQIAYAPDPTWGAQTALPVALTITTPSGISAQFEAARKMELATAADPLSLARLEETSTLNGRKGKREYSAASRTWTNTTPVGRSTVTRLNVQGRVVEVRPAGLPPILYSYDSRGRVAAVDEGSGDAARKLSVEYGPSGRPSKITDALGRVTAFAYDDARRPVQITRPDGEVVALGYNPAGRLESLKAPGRSAHTFQYSPVGLLSTAQPPGGVPAATWSWNADRDLTSAQFPDGTSLRRTYDDAGRLKALDHPSGRLDLSYDSRTGLPVKAIDRDGNALSWVYDGRFPAQDTWSGAVNGTLRRTFDRNFHLASLRVNESAPVGLTYDDDGLLLSAGDLNLKRDPASGKVVSAVLDRISGAIVYNAFGEIVDSRVTSPAGLLFSSACVRDRGGRITDNAETAGGVTVNYHYLYDSAGRLAGVDQNGAALARYAYDANGNRLQVTGPAGPVSATFDGQDRLTQQGDLSYTYDANGRLLTKSSAGATTAYTYDLPGNLTNVRLPGGRGIKYLVDALNRRTGKLVNGSLVQAFLWQDGLRPVAELDAGGQVVSTFVFARASGPPAYLIKGGVKYRIIADLTASPRLVVNAATGEIVQKLDYDPFGKVVNDTNPGFQPFGFSGGLYDPDTGLLRFGARDYDPATGRWTAPDPIGFGGGDTNLYSYCGNDPVNGHDPTGRDDGSQSGGLLTWGRSVVSAIPVVGELTALMEGAIWKFIDEEQAAAEHDADLRATWQFVINTDIADEAAGARLMQQPFFRNAVDEAAERFCPKPNPDDKNRLIGFQSRITAATYLGYRVGGY